MNKVYMAGPLFSRAEQSWNHDLAAMLSEFDCELPQVFCHGLTDLYAIARLCISVLQKCDVVLANLDGADADSGTSFEVGFAYASDIPVVGYRTDFRQTGDTGSVNAMFLLCDELVLLKPGQDIKKVLTEPLRKFTWQSKFPA